MYACVCTFSCVCVSANRGKKPSHTNTLVEPYFHTECVKWQRTRWKAERLKTNGAIEIFICIYQVAWSLYFLQANYVRIKIYTRTTILRRSRFRCSQSIWLLYACIISSRIKAVSNPYTLDFKRSRRASDGYWKWSLCCHSDKSHATIRINQWQRNEPRRIRRTQQHEVAKNPAAIKINESNLHILFECGISRWYAYIRVLCGPHE